MEKTTEKQENERGPFEFEKKHPDHFPVCFVCRSVIKEGESVYRIKVVGGRYRHSLCARAPSSGSAKSAPITEEEHIKRTREERTVKGSDKKQKTGGHGYTGGTGYKNL